MTPTTSRSSLPPATESMTLLVAAVIVHDKTHEQVLLVQRGPRAKFAPGSWDLPVGKAAPGESVLATAVRELAEETGLVVRPADLSVAHVIHSSYGVEAPAGFLTVVFAARRWSGEVANREPEKHSRTSWISVAELPDDMVDTTGAALRHYLAEGPMLSLSGW